MKGKYLFHTVDLRISNNHLGALQSIQKFLGCGYITKNNNSYNFVIRNHRDVARVAEELIPRIIIKRDKLRCVLSFIQGKEWQNDGPLSFVTRNQLLELYLNKGMTSSAIAKKLGCSRSGVRKRLLKWGIAKPFERGPRARRKP